MEIRVLRYFLAIAREESITNASNFLHITQPTLSRQIKELEEELGHPLFYRKSHSMTLTPEGIIFRKRAEEIIDMVDKTWEEFSSMGAVLSGDIYIGGGETKAIKLIGEVVKELLDEHPNIRYHLYSGNSIDVTEKLDRGLLDFGIVIDPADISKYDYLPMPAKDVWGVIMRKDSSLAAKEYITKEDLLGRPVLCSRQAITGGQSDNAYMKWFGDDYKNMNVVTTFNLLYNAAVMVERGVGYAISIDKIADTSDSSALCFRPLYPPLESGLNIIWKKYQVFSPAAEAFLEKIQSKWG